MTKTQLQISKICLSSLFLALGWLMPFITGQIQQIGSMFLPMHFPILLAGFILGPWYGLLLGFITPITRSLIFGMPPLFPTSISMAFELATYGFVAGFLFQLIYRKFNKINIYFNICISLISSLILGRVIYAIVMSILMLISSKITFNWSIFINGVLLNAWPGILIQLFLIPSIIIFLYKAKILQKYIYQKGNVEGINVSELTK